jgi:hypothetical protein
MRWTRHRAVTSDGADRSERRAVATHRLHALDHSLLAHVGDKLLHFAVENDVKAERPLPSTEYALRSQMTLGVADALSQPVALALGDSGENCEHHLRHAVADHVAAEMDHVHADALSPLARRAR